MEKSGVSFSYRIDFWNHVWVSWILGWRKIWMYLIFFAMGCLPAWSLPATIGAKLAFAFLFMAAGVFVLIPLLTLGKVVFHRSKGAFFRDDFLFQINEEGVVMRNPVMESAIKWRGLSKVAETGRYFLLYVSNRQATFLIKPKIDPVLWPEIRAFIRHGVPKSRLKD